MGSWLEETENGCVGQATRAKAYDAALQVGEPGDSLYVHRNVPGLVHAESAGCYCVPIILTIQEGDTPESLSQKAQRIEARPN